VAIVGVVHHVCEVEENIEGTAKKESYINSLTFRGPCSIVIFSYNESQRDALFLTFI
jgi:hypothetical protein